jgi:hypothetical protein
MTALNIATQIPTNIVTVEQLSVWCSNVLFNLNRTVVAAEGVNFSQSVAQAGEFYIASTDQTRHVGRQSIQLDPAYAIGGVKPWMYAEEISQKPLSAAMTSN